jgi:hypothetical protein
LACVLSESERIQGLLCALPEPALRTAFLRDYVGAGDDPKPARALDEIWAARGERAAREPILAIAMTLAGLAEHPMLDELGHTAAAFGLANLARLLRRAPVLSPDEGVPPRTPEYAPGREVSLGERRALARRPSRAMFDKLLRDPHPLVIAQLLANPLLTENDVVRLAALRPGNAEALRAIARTIWLCRPRVRMAIIQNPKTPSAVAVPLVCACTTAELAEIRRATECAVVVRTTAEELLLERRSSLQPSSSSSSSQLSSAPSVTLEAHCSQRGGSS